MTGKPTWTMREILWILDQYQRDQTAQQIYFKFISEFLPNPKHSFNISGIRYVCTTYSKDPNYNHKFNNEELAFIFGIKHAQIVMHGRDHPRSTNEDVLHYFLSKFPQHEWPPYAQPGRGIEFALVKWEKAIVFREFWETDHVNFLIDAQALKIPRNQIVRIFRQIWPSREICETRVHYVIWRNVFECFWGSAAFDPPYDCEGAVHSYRKRKRDEDTIVDQYSHKKSHQMYPKLSTLPTFHPDHHYLHASQEVNNQIYLRNGILSEAVLTQLPSYEIGYRDFIQNDGKETDADYPNHEEFYQELSDSLCNATEHNVCQRDFRSDNADCELNIQPYWSTPQSSDLTQRKLSQDSNDGQNLSDHLCGSSSSTPHFLCQPSPAYQNPHSYDLIHSCEPNFPAISRREAEMNFEILGLQSNETELNMSTHNEPSNGEIHNVADDVKTHTQIEPFIDNRERHTVRDSPTVADFRINADPMSPLSLVLDLDDIATAGALLSFTSSQTAELPACNLNEQSMSLHGSTGDLFSHHCSSKSYERPYSMTDFTEELPVDMVKWSGLRASDQQLDGEDLESGQVAFAPVHRERQLDEAISSPLPPSSANYHHEAPTKKIWDSSPFASKPLDPGLSEFLISTSEYTSQDKGKSETTPREIADSRHKNLPNALPNLPLPNPLPKEKHVTFALFSRDNTPTTIDFPAPELSQYELEQNAASLSRTPTATDQSPSERIWSNELFLSDAPEPDGFEFNAQLLEFLPGQAGSALAPPSNSIEWDGISGFTP